MKHALMVFSIILLICAPLRANEERIPLNSIRRPSDDLIFKGQVLTAEQAWKLQNEADSVDLSLLDPMDSEVWNPSRSELLSNEKVDDLALSQESTLNFKGTISSNQGLIRFNGQIEQSDDDDGVYTVMMSKTLHTALLRKNLLRKLGYIIPAIKYLPKLKVTFSSIEQRDIFLTKSIPEATYGAPSRWLGFNHNDLKDDQLEITLHDVAVLKPSQSDHYNVAMGVPSKVLTSRTLRSLIIPYALLNLGESVNKFPWNVGQVDNEYLSLPHFFPTARFNATMDDALWMARILKDLKEDDFKEIVRDAFFPKAVEVIVLEKLKARRNALLEILELETNKLSVNLTPDFGELLDDGQLTKEDWKGYATRFAHGDPESPFKDFEYFAFSKIQNSVLSNLVTLVNDKLSVFDPTQERLEFMNDQFQEGLDHFVETGEFMEFGVGTWFSPTLDGKLIMSRDIVVGNYLGTDNLVQLADTVGVGVSLGGVLGIENALEFSSLAVSAEVSVVRTYTHLKPVKTLKESFKEPYKNVIVPLIKRNLAKRFDELAAVKDQEIGELDEDEVDPRLEVIEGLLLEINEGLGVGETLLITDRITPQLMGNGGANIMGTRVSLSAGVSGVFIKRLQIYRKDASTIQIYEDKGKGRTLLMSVAMSKYIPILRLSQSQTKGKYSVEVRDVNISTNLEENPHLFTNALGLHQLFDENSSELLDVNTDSTLIEGEFKDNSSKFSLLVWKAKYLKGNLDVSVTPERGPTANFVILNKESQSGINYQAFVYEVLNYYMGQWFEDLPISPQIDPETYKNPGQSIFGVSETEGTRFEARDNEGVMEYPLLALTYRKEGWSARKRRLKKYIEEINDDFGFTLFDGRSLDNAQGLRLFDINVNINIYDSGIEKLRNLDDDEIKELSREYSRSRSGECGSSRRNNRIRTARTLIECGNLNILRDKNKKCQRLDKSSHLTKEMGQCLVDLAAQMKKDLEFKDFISLIGVDNLYIYGLINGFRTESEILNEPIRSHSMGAIKGKYWNGPIERVKEILGVQSGEFNGLWIRETL